VAEQEGVLELGPLVRGGAAVERNLLVLEGFEVALGVDCEFVGLGFDGR
jgi:hypothetical protein